MVERLFVIARLDLLLAALEPGIAEVGGLFVDAGKLVTVGIDDRHVPFAYHVDERLIAEALVAHLDLVAQLPAVLRIGKQVEEAREIVAIDLLSRHEWPEIGRSSSRYRVCHEV